MPSLSLEDPQVKAELEALEIDGRSLAFEERLALIDILIMRNWGYASRNGLNNQTVSLLNSCYALRAIVRKQMGQADG